MGSRHRDWLAHLRPGLDDAGIDRLRMAVRPYLVPGQVEALYRWHDGGDSGVFGGWRMRPVEELIDWYGFSCKDLESPRTWLPVFDDQIVNVVTLDVPGVPLSDPSVWYGTRMTDGSSAYSTRSRPCSTSSVMQPKMACSTRATVVVGCAPARGWNPSTAGPGAGTGSAVARPASNVQMGLVSETGPRRLPETTPSLSTRV